MKRTQPPILDPEKSRPWMVSMLPNAEQPDIDKFAIMLLSTPSQIGKGAEEMEQDKKPKMIGLVGTNRWCKEGEGTGLETGYCLNNKYWGMGYATEALSMFLKYYWTLSGTSSPFSCFIRSLSGKIHNIDGRCTND